MKSSIVIAFYIMFMICLYVFGVWALIDFILYLAKDQPFDKWLLWALGISFLGYLISGIWAFTAK